GARADADGAFQRGGSKVQAARRLLPLGFLEQRDHGGVLGFGRRFRRSLGRGGRAARPSGAGAERQQQYKKCDSHYWKISRMRSVRLLLHTGRPCGAEPAMKASSLALPQPEVEGASRFMSTQASSMPAGRAGTKSSCAASRISRTQTGKAPLAPVSIAGSLLSRPIHTTATRSPEKPANQLSRKSSVVPVLPATRTSSARPAALAVPLRVTSSNAWLTRYTARGSTDSLTVSG